MGKRFTKLNELLQRKLGAAALDIARLLEKVESEQGDSPPSLPEDLRALKSRINALSSSANVALAEAAKEDRGGAEQAQPDDRLLSILKQLLEIKTTELGNLCDRALELLIEATRAESGFFAVHYPSSSEVEVVSARNFSTPNLSLEEYAFSRTVLREVFANRRQMLLDDAVKDPRYKRARSVQALGLRSIIAVPLITGSIMSKKL